MNRSWSDVLIVTLATVSLTWLSVGNAPQTHQIDCTMLVGGWHPDVPAGVRDGCNSPNKMT